MKKVKLNESQLRRLVRGMIRETYGDNLSDKALDDYNRSETEGQRRRREEEINYGDSDAYSPLSRPSMSASDAAYRYKAPSEAVGTYNIMLNSIKDRFSKGEDRDGMPVDANQLAQSIVKPGGFFDQYSEKVYGGDVAATVSALLSRANLPPRMKRALVDWEETKGY